MTMRRYPRTHHIEGSRLQAGDEDATAIPFTELRGRHLVVEEKIDGANCGISFSDDGAATLLLQSRGHYLRGGARERHFELFKAWATRHRDVLYERLATTKIAYGEWCYAKHTIFYDLLPHFFLEFDVLDTTTDRFLSTPERRALWQGAPVCSVPVLHEGTVASLDALTRMITASRFKSARWRDALRTSIAESDERKPERVVDETEPSDLAEGLYVKDETGGSVGARYKWVRHGFLQTVIESDSHWIDRPIVVNRLAPGVDIFA